MYRALENESFNSEHTRLLTFAFLGRLWRNVQVFNLKRTLAALLLVQYNPEKKTLEPFAEYRWLYRLLT